MARAYELLCRTQRTRERIFWQGSQVRAAGFDLDQRGMREGGRDVPSPDLRLDGARVSERKDAGRDLVGGTPDGARARGLGAGCYLGVDGGAQYGLLCDARKLYLDEPICRKQIIFS